MFANNVCFRSEEDCTHLITVLLHLFNYAVKCSRETQLSLTCNASSYIQKNILLNQNPTKQQT